MPSRFSPRSFPRTRVAASVGTGKELVARAIQETGPRRDKPFVSLNCYQDFRPGQG